MASATLAPAARPPPRRRRLSRPAVARGVPEPAARAAAAARLPAPRAPVPDRLSGNPITSTRVGLNPTTLDSTQHGVEVFGRLLWRRLFYHLALVQGAQGPDGVRDLDGYKDLFGELQVDRAPPADAGRAGVPRAHADPGRRARPAGALHRPPSTCLAASAELDTAAPQPVRPGAVRQPRQPLRRRRARRLLGLPGGGAPRRSGRASSSWRATISSARTTSTEQAFKHATVPPRVLCC